MMGLQLAASGSGNPYVNRIAEDGPMGSRILEKNVERVTEHVEAQTYTQADFEADFKAGRAVWNKKDQCWDVSVK